MQVTYEIVEKIAVLKEGKNGMKKELNLVSWNDNDPKYDIRWWANQNKEIGKGITLTSEEFLILADVINNRNRDKHPAY